MVLSDNVIFIPGWNGLYNLNDLFLFKTVFNRDDISASTLNYFIIKGEYVCDFPLGIIKIQKEYYTLTNRQIPHNKIFSIKVYVGEIINASPEKPIYDKTAFEAFFHTLLDSFFIEIGFEKPNNTRTFLGKSSKGKLSYRKEKPEFSISLSNEFFESKVNIYRSVNHQVFVDINSFYITLLPNFEVYGNYLDLPLSEEQKEQLENYDLWTSTVYMKPDTIVKRYNSYCDQIKDKFTLCKFINKVEANNVRLANILERNENFVIIPNNSILSLESHKSFEEQSFNYFKANRKNLPSISIDVLIDSHGIKLKEDEQKKLENYIQQLGISDFFKVQNVVHFDEIENISFSDDHNYFVILNDLCPGSGFIHDFIKSTTNISKCVKVSTILSLKDDIENQLLLWLSFYFRIYKTLIWHKNKKNPFKRIITFNSFLEKEFHHIRLSITILNVEKLGVQKVKQLFFLPTDKRILTSKTIAIALLRSLRADFNFPNKDDLYLITEGHYSQFFEEELEKIANFVIIKKPHSRILSYNDNNFDFPLNGTYVQLNNIRNSYLLITTGKPDNIENGLPNPLCIEIHKISEDISDQMILQTIFDLSFYQPNSFAKTSMPFLIELNNEDLFIDLPKKYNKEVPY